MELRDLTFAVVDCETTGSGAHGGDRITEVAVVLLRNGEITTAAELNARLRRAAKSVALSLANWKSANELNLTWPDIQAHHW